MYDIRTQRPEHLLYDAFGDMHPIRLATLIEALEEWSADQPPGRKLTARDVSVEVQRYRRFKSRLHCGPGRCARIILSDPRWHKSGRWLIKAPAPIPTPPGAIAAWLDGPEPPQRAQVKVYAELYSAYAALNKWPPISARAIVPHLIKSGYCFVSRPHNKAIYARPDCWI
jgi:hypothetical protein